MKRKYFRIRRCEYNRYILIKDGWVTIYTVNLKSRTMIEKYSIIKSWYMHSSNLKHRVRANKYERLMWGRNETMEDYDCDYDYNHYQDYQDWLDSLEILC